MVLCPRLNDWSWLKFCLLARTLGAKGFFSKLFPHSCKHILLHNRFFRERISRARVVFCPQLFKRYKSNENQLRYPLDRDKSTLWTTEGWGPFFEIPEITEPRKVGFPDSMELQSVLFFLGTNSKTGNRFHGFWFSQNAKKKKTNLLKNNNNNNTLLKALYLRASYWTQTPISFTVLF